MFRERDFFKKIFFPRIFLAALIILTFFIALSTGRAIWRKYRIEREISALKNNISEIEERNKELLTRLDYFKSEENLEKEARIQLNVKRPGEKVVVIVGKQNQNSGIENAENLEGNEPADKGIVSNPLKWWRYFFGEITIN